MRKIESILTRKVSLAIVIQVILFSVALMSGSLLSSQVVGCGSGTLMGPSQRITEMKSLKSLSLVDNKIIKNSPVIAWLKKKGLIQRM